MHKVNILLKVIICSVLFSGLFMMNACKSDSPNEKEKTEKAAKKGAKKGAKGKNNKAKTGKTVNTKYKNVTAQAFKLRMEKQKGAVILDCRTPKEFKAGSVPGAKNINFRDKNFAKQIAALDKSKRYYVYCQSGGRSKKASVAMADAGFKKVFNVKGGYGAYSKLK